MRYKFTEYNKSNMIVGTNYNFREYGGLLNKYVKITNLDDLQVGDKVIIVSFDYYVLSKTQSTNRRNAYQLVNGIDADGNIDITMLSETDIENICELELGKVSSYYTFYDSNLQGYLGMTSNTNRLDTITSVPDPSAEARVQWDIALGQYTDTSIPKILNIFSTTRWLQKMSGTPPYFRCYASNQGAVYIFKRS